MQKTEAILGQRTSDLRGVPVACALARRRGGGRPGGFLVAAVSIGLVCVLLHPQGARAQSETKSVAAWVKEGNEHLAGGRHREALAAFDQAHALAPDSAVVSYDRGVALYRLGEYGEAEEAFQNALRPEMPDLEAKAKYNLGRCAHAQAVAGAGELQSAIEKIEDAIEFYQGALQLRPDDGDAKRNLAQAERLQKYLKKKLELLRQQQEQEQEPSTQPGDQEQEPSSQPSDQNQQSSQPSQDEQQEGESEEPSSRPDEQQGEPQDEDQSEQEQDADAPSSRPYEGEAQEEPPEPATQPQVQPATQSATQPDDEATTQPETTPAAAPTTQPEDPEEMLRRISREQALRMLQEARDAERERREVLREMLLRRQGRIPVDKDW